MFGEKRCSVMPVTEHPAGSAMLNRADAGGARDESDLRGFGPWFRVRNRHDRDLGHCAGRVMRELLMFLGRGFALFAGGPAVVYQYPALHRSAAMFEA
jgi:hypothetical protein